MDVGSSPEAVGGLVAAVVAIVGVTVKWIRDASHRSDAQSGVAFAELHKLFTISTEQLGAERTRVAELTNEKAAALAANAKMRTELESHARRNADLGDEVRTLTAQRDEARAQVVELTAEIERERQRFLEQLLRAADARERKDP